MLNFNKPKPILDSQPKPRVIFPYVPGLTEKTARLIGRKLGNPAGYIPYQRMSEITSTHKDKTPCLNCGVYQIDCSCGMLYIGQTGRDFKDRITEHKRYTSNGDTCRSAISEHVWSDPNTNHDILWNQGQIIDKENRHFQRCVKESIYIQKAIRTKKPLMNRKNECPHQKLPVCYNEVLDQIF